MDGTKWLVEIIVIGMFIHVAIYTKLALVDSQSIETEHNVL